MRPILDGTVVRVRPDRKATTISLLVVLGVRRDGRKILPAVGNIGGASEAARRAVLDDPVARGRRTPEFLIIDGAAGLDKALAALRPMVPTQRCTVPKHRNLLAHAPDRLHAAVSADCTGMIYAGTAAEVGPRPMPLRGCARSASGGSGRRRSRRAPRPRRCPSGRGAPRGRSRRAGSTAGRRSPNGPPGR